MSSFMHVRTRPQEVDEILIIFFFCYYILLLLLCGFISRRVLDLSFSQTHDDREMCSYKSTLLSQSDSTLSTNSMVSLESIVLALQESQLQLLILYAATVSVFFIAFFVVSEGLNVRGRIDIHPLSD